MLANVLTIDGGVFGSHCNNHSCLLKSHHWPVGRTNKQEIEKSWAKRNVLLSVKLPSSNHKCQRNLTRTKCQQIGYNANVLLNG